MMSLYYILTFSLIVLVGLQQYLDKSIADFLYMHHGSWWMQAVQPWHSFFYTLPKCVTALSMLFWLGAFFYYRKGEQCVVYGRALLYASTLILLVVLLKRYTATSCPWDHKDYGGVVEGARWLGQGTGFQCFPAGHATSASALLGWLYLPRLRNIMVLWWTIVGWTLIIGGYQMLRGAHYMTHTAMTLWLSFLLWRIVFKLPLAVARKKL